MEAKVSLVVHPQVTLSIGQHYSRSVYFETPVRYVVGLLFGNATDNKIEIGSAIEAPFTSNDHPAVKGNDYRTIVDHHQKNHLDEVPVGWYTVRPLEPAQIAEIQTELSSRFQPSIRAEYNEDKDVPISFFLFKNNKWIPLDYSYESILAERVALSQLQSEGKEGSAYYNQIYSALSEKLEELQNYLQAVMDGKRKFDPILMRRIATIARWWRIDKTAESEVLIREEAEAELSLLYNLIAEKVTILSTSSR